MEERHFGKDLSWGRRKDMGSASSETLLLLSSHSVPYFVEKLYGARRKPGVMIVEEPQDTNASLEQLADDGNPGLHLVRPVDDDPVPVLGLILDAFRSPSHLR